MLGQPPEALDTVVLATDDSEEVACDVDFASCDVELVDEALTGIEELAKGDPDEVADETVGREFVVEGPEVLGIARTAAPAATAIMTSTMPTVAIFPMAFLA